MTTVKIGCAEAVRRLWDFLEDGLDATGHQEVEAHLAWCRRCCGELEFTRELKRLLRARTTAELPRELQERLDRVIDGFDGEPDGDCE